MQSELALLTVGEQPAQRDEMTISDLARTYGVSLRTLRFYEDKDLLHPRRHGTARFYSIRDRIRLELILKGKRLGFTLSEIYELIASREKLGVMNVSADPADLTVTLGREQIASQIAHLQRQRQDLDAAIAELQKANGRMHESVG